jgi:hypothetical protein
MLPMRDGGRFTFAAYWHAVTVLFEIGHDSPTKHQRKIASERLEKHDQSFASILGATILWSSLIAA